MAEKRAVIFDLGNVIVPFDFKRGYARLAERSPYGAAEIPERLRGTDLVVRLETGLIEPRAFVDEMSRLLDYGGTYEDFCGIWTSIFLPETLVTEEIVQALVGRYRLVVLSNTNAIHIEMVRDAYPILRHFDALVLSHEVKAMKPSPAIYAAAVEAAGVRPEECFFTDDILEYVEGARRFGIDAEQFLGVEKLKGDLKVRGIEV